MPPSPLSQGAAALTLAAALIVPMATHAAEAMRVVRDPQTGELRGPTAAEAAAFAKAEAQLRAAKSGKAATATAAPQEITHPDGSIETPLGEDTMLSSVVTLEADGTMRMHCLPARQAAALVKQSSKKVVAAKTAGRVAP